MLPQDDDDVDNAMCWISETLWRRRNDAFSGNRFNSGFNIIQFFHLTQISPDFSKQSDDDQYDDVDEKGDHDDNNEDEDNGDNDYLMTATKDGDETSEFSTWPKSCQTSQNNWLMTLIWTMMIMTIL